MIKVTEAEVIIDLAKFLISEKIIQGKVQISLDGMHKKIFPSWKERIQKYNIADNIVEEKKSGFGDIVALFTEHYAEKLGKKNLFIECKKGSFQNLKNSNEYKLMREAIGQIATYEKYKFDSDTIYAIGVPKSERTISLSKKWIEFEGVQRLDIKILLVDENQNVSGLLKDVIL